MNELLAKAVAAHGGIDRWRKFKRISATMVAGGLLAMKGLEVDPNLSWVRRQRAPKARYRGFRASGRKEAFRKLLMRGAR